MLSGSNHAEISTDIFSHKEFHSRKWKRSTCLGLIIVALNMPESQAFSVDENKLFMPNPVKVCKLQASSSKLRFLSGGTVYSLKAVHLIMLPNRCCVCFYISSFNIFPWDNCVFQHFVIKLLVLKVENWYLFQSSFIFPYRIIKIN